MRTKANRIFTLCIVTLALVCGRAFEVHAATLKVVPTATSYAVGDTVRVRVAVASDAQSINGVAATINFPTDILSLSSISKTGSIMTLWAQEPSFSNTTGTAKFEAVALNGFTGSNGTVVTLLFKAKKEGTATIEIPSGSVLANNGEGTNVLDARQSTKVTIGPARQSTATPPADAPVVPQTPVSTHTLSVEELPKADPYTPYAQFRITTSLTDPLQQYDIQIDDLPLITWQNDGTHIFQTPQLARGTHLIKFKTITPEGDLLTAFADFTTKNLNQPTITDYPNNVFSGEYIVLKGITDPFTKVVVTTTRVPARFPFFARITGVNPDTRPTDASTVANEKGEFNYISPDKVSSGTYSLYARAVSDSGLQSSPTTPIRIVAHDDVFSRVTLWLTNTLSLIIPLIALLFALFFIIIYTLAKYKRFKKRVAADLLVGESDVRKKFQAIDADLEEYARLLLKSHSTQHLTEAERTALMQIKQDIVRTQDSVSSTIKKTQDAIIS